MLANQLTRPILHPVPPASACYSTSAHSGSCSDVIANFRNSQWRSDQPGAMEYTNFESFTPYNGTTSACYLDTTLGIPCRQGSVPPVGVEVHSASDVQAAVHFARQHNLKLVVKGTGHDFLGRSTARGSFLIWTRHLNEMVYNPTFVPEGAPVTTENTFNGDFLFVFSHLPGTYVQYVSVVTLGAGVQWREAFKFIEQYGRFVVGGSPTVGAAGGWVMGGGHGPMSPSYGLGTLLSFSFIWLAVELMI